MDFSFPLLPSAIPNNMLTVAILGSGSKDTAEHLVAGASPPTTPQISMTRQIKRLDLAPRSVEPLIMSILSFACGEASNEI